MIVTNGLINDKEWHFLGFRKEVKFKKKGRFWRTKTSYYYKSTLIYWKEGSWFEVIL